jgi:hypothetical protein
MSARRTAIQLATKATIGFAALFLVSVLLAAMPGHHAPTVGSPVGSSAASGGATQEQAPAQPDHSSAMGMKPRGSKKTKDTAAVKDMSSASHSPHTPDVTTTRPQTP